MTQLKRQAFDTSRMMDFFSQKELTAQIGHSSDEWLQVCLKELLDNSLDACEEAGIAPEIDVIVNADGISVSDNANGIPSTTIEKMLDFTVKVSSREAYVSPDRGAQGNALKTLVAMPLVLDGKHGRVEIHTQGIAHSIICKVDQIRQEPIISHKQNPGKVKNGTFVKIHFPDLASYMVDEKRQFLLLAQRFAFTNPHLTVHIDWFGESFDWSASNPEWTSWSSNNPTSAHWYREQELTRLIAAYLSQGKEMSMRDFVSEFRGLSSSAKLKKVLNATGLARKPLNALVRDGEIDTSMVTTLLCTMQDHSKQVGHGLLGTIGEKHIRERLNDCEMDSFKYAKKAGITDGLPWVLEVAFVWRGDNSSRQLITGVNWSAGINNPFRTVGYTSLNAVLSDQFAGSEMPVIFFVHLACPRVTYRDRGKSSVILNMDSDILLQLTKRVTNDWKRQRTREIKSSNAIARRREKLNKPPKKISMKKAAARIMETAYLKASSNGTLPASARQVMYAARKYIQEASGKTLDGNYFSQTLLPDFMGANPELTANWDVTMDARGNFLEPHTGKKVPLGTLEVRGYLQQIRSGVQPTAAMHPFVIGNLTNTVGHKNRFNAVMFIEKEGFMPLFKKVRLAERYDIAIMSTKGMSVIASRRLVDELCNDVPLLIVRDFDKAGFSIATTLLKDTSRYTFKNKIKYIDLGLRLDDARKFELEAEDVGYDSDPRDNLIQNGATKEEVNFLCTSINSYTGNAKGKRIELNTFSSGQLVEWLEEKLEENGIKKVIPDTETLEAAYRNAYKMEMLQKTINKEIKKLEKKAETLEIPDDLEEQVQDIVDKDRSLPWDKAIHRVEKTRQEELRVF